MVGRAGMITGEPGGSLPCWIDDNALWGVITPAGRLRCAAASKLLLWSQFFKRCLNQTNRTI